VASCWAVLGSVRTARGDTRFPCAFRLCVSLVRFALNLSCCIVPMSYLLPPTPELYLDSFRNWNAAFDIEAEALRIHTGRSGFTDSLNGRGQDVRLFGAILDETSKLAEERRPSKPAI
jgi:hypothetical protein